MATRGGEAELPDGSPTSIAALQGGRVRPGDRRDARASGRATPAIVPFADCSLYVMTPEFGAASQLEKIDMLDFADVVAINKFERRGAEDALPRRARGSSCATARRSGTTWRGHAGVRHQRRHVQRRRRHRALPAPARPARRARARPSTRARCRASTRKASTEPRTIIPPARVRYLAEIAETVRGYHAATDASRSAGRAPRQHLRTAQRPLAEAGADAGADWPSVLEAADASWPPRPRELLDAWPAVVEAYSGDELVVTVRDRELRTR